MSGNATVPNTVIKPSLIQVQCQTMLGCSLLTVLPHCPDFHTIITYPASKWMLVHCSTDLTSTGGMWVMPEPPWAKAFTSQFNGVWAAVLFDPLKGTGGNEKICLESLAKVENRVGGERRRQRFFCAGLPLKSTAGRTASDLVQSGEHAHFSLWCPSLEERAIGWSQSINARGVALL